MIERLEAMLADGQDSAGLRFALATHYLKQREHGIAIEHASRAVALDPEYSAAWRLLGQAQAGAGMTDAAARTFEQGIEVARRAGDRQVEKEMQVFRKRLDKPGSAERS